jgi:hypothetical protein
MTPNINFSALNGTEPEHPQIVADASIEGTTSVWRWRRQIRTLLFGAFAAALDDDARAIAGRKAMDP